MSVALGHYVSGSFRAKVMATDLDPMVVASWYRSGGGFRVIVVLDPMAVVLGRWWQKIGFGFKEEMGVVTPSWQWCW